MNSYGYVWLRKDATPYYVGKTNRLRRAFGERHSVHPPKDHSRIVVVKVPDEKVALECEKDLITRFGRKNIGTGCLRNLTEGGEGTTGFIHSPETRKRMSLHRLGNRNAAGNQNHLGHRHSSEAIAKMSAAKIGRKLSPATKAKMSAALQGNQRSLGYKHSPEAKAKIAAASRSRSPETIAKISATLRQRVMSPETRAKISAAMQGNRNGAKR
jgi:hypothetical protein